MQDAETQMRLRNFDARGPEKSWLIQMQLVQRMLLMQEGLEGELQCWSD